MNSSKIKCENCGQEITKERLSLESLVKCPVCDDILPRDNVDGATHKGLKIRGNRSLNEDYLTCPNCDSLNPEGATLCTSCGYNFVTGKKVKTTYQKKRDIKAWKNPIIIVVCLIALATLLFFRMTKESSVPLPESAGPTIEDLQRDDFETWKNEFETSLPTLKAGDEVQLELKTGRIIRGQIQALDSDEVTLFSAIGIEKIPHNTISGQSLVQISIKARNAYIETNRKRIFGE